MAPKVNTKVKAKKESKESKDALDQYRKMLMKRREELAASVKSHAQELPDTGLEGVAGDSSDHAAADYTAEMFGVLLERQAGTLEEVERAIGKLDTGEFGVCEMCEKAIPSKRIKALPWARCCLECQEKEDRIGALKRLRANQTEWEAADD
ncbi:MAG: TraR/DksA family transcriptional regulator [Phycisphaerae bacterium]